MSNYTSPTFETSDFQESELICTSQYEDEIIYDSSICVRWKLNIKFDESGVWSMSPEITWVQVKVEFQVDEIEPDPQKKKEASRTWVDFTPKTKGWDVTIDVEPQTSQMKEYRCSSAYINVDDQTAELIFG